MSGSRLSVISSQADPWIEVRPMWTFEEELSRMLRTATDHRQLTTDNGAGGAL